MNQPRLEKLKTTAKRTLKILELIEVGLTAREIVEKSRADRQLVDYYIKQVTRKD